ncbi:hypothetical protein [Paraburkholderia phosphatilytica]|uniref:hypothetical protein n=1 Tax=Paraburkholderia phosphatilytica TaxID=2282883 RepID=UPI000E4DD880|nr:hypothetical protein [Paraburkholderia phosphatilytica]
MSTAIQAAAPRKSPGNVRAGGVNTNLIHEITRDALRRAALAPTYMDALDITGAALLAAAAVARMGSGRGTA